MDTSGECRDERCGGGLSQWLRAHPGHGRGRGPGRGTALGQYLPADCRGGRGHAMGAPAPGRRDHLRRPDLHGQRLGVLQGVHGSHFRLLPGPTVARQTCRRVHQFRLPVRRQAQHLAADGSVRRPAFDDLGRPRPVAGTQQHRSVRRPTQSPRQFARRHGPVECRTVPDDAPPAEDRSTAAHLGERIARLAERLHHSPL